VLYACVRCQAFENSLSVGMLAGRRELLAGAAQDKAERVPAVRFTHSSRIETSGVERFVERDAR